MNLKCVQWPIECLQKYKQIIKIMAYKLPHSLSFIPFNRTRMEELKIQKRPENNNNNKNSVRDSEIELNIRKEKESEEKWEKKKRLANTDWVTFVRKLLPITVGRTWADAAIRTSCMICTHGPYRLHCSMFMRSNMGERDSQLSNDKDRRMDFDGNMAAIKKLHLLTNTWTMFNVHALMGVYTGSCVSVALIPFYTWSN